MNVALPNIDFEPLTEVKAKLSEKVAKVNQTQRLLAITLNGKPAAILIPYTEFLTWVQSGSTSYTPRVIDFTEWEKNSEQRRAVSASIKSMFDMSLLKRKGQKPYKQNALKKFKKT